MRVLLLYQYLNHKDTVSALADHLKPKGIEIDCLDLPNLNFTSKEQGLSDYLMRFIKIDSFKRFLLSCLRKFYLLSQIKKYDIIDIHSYSLYYNRIIPTIKKQKKPLIIMIWGSDFYRASDKELEEKRLGFELADIIHVESEHVKSDFVKKFPEYRNKIYIVQFGLNQLDWLKDAMISSLTETSLIDFDTFKSKIVITCGYNGFTSQQHIKMINAIICQTNEIKSKIHVIIPFTYGGNENYKNEIEMALKNACLSYTILDKRLSDNQMVELRRISHVAINIQTTDSFSASIQEHFMSGSVQILGEWLPYDIFYNQGLYAVKTSIGQLANNIENVLTHYSDYYNKCKNNSDIIYHFSSWEYITTKWVAMYNKCLSIGTEKYV